MSGIHDRLLRAAVLCAVLAAAVAALLLPGSLLATEDGTSIALRDLWPATGWEEEARRGQQLDADHEMIYSSLVAKHLVVSDLIAVRLTLAEAVGRFQGLDAQRPPHLRARFHEALGEPTDACYARHIIEWAQARLEYRPDQQAVLDRLEAELRDGLTAGADRPSSRVPHESFPVLPQRRS